MSVSQFIDRRILFFHEIKDLHVLVHLSLKKVLTRKDRQLEELWAC